MKSVQASRPRGCTRRSPCTLRGARAAALPSGYTSVTPVGDRVLLKLTEEASTTAGGIVLPSSALNKPTFGVVVSVGDGRNAKTGVKMPIDVTVGDRVVFSKFAGTEVKIGGVDHLIIKSEDVVGTLVGDSIGALKPYGDRVLLQKAHTAPSTAGGVLLPGGGSDAVPTGRVVAVGPGKLRDDGGRDALTLSPGSAVLYAQFAGIEYTAEPGTDAGYVVLRGDDIIVAMS